jgi:rubredoxin
MEMYKCVICGYIYNPAEGDQSAGIEPGIPFPDLPIDYICPVCGAGKDEFLIYE